MATLTNTKIKDTYDGLLKTTDNDVIGASEKVITDGLGNASVLSIGTGSASFSSDIEVNGLTIGKGNGGLSTNVAVGVNTLDSVTSGVDNTAVGHSAMQNVTQGVDNVAYGTGAMVSTTTGSYNTSIGSASLPANTTGGSNTAVGLQVMQSNTTGGANTVVGMSALNDNTEGNRNTTLGFGSGNGIITGSDNVHIGYNTTSAASDVTNEIVIGASATGNGSNTATYGNSSILNHYFTAGNVHIDGAAYIGAAIVDSNGEAGENGQILSSTVTGTEWIDAPSSATPTLDQVTGAGETSSRNVVINGADLGTITNSSNTLFGDGALASHTTGSFNTAIGQNALTAYTGGSDNTAVGAGTLDAIISSGNLRNTAVGSNALGSGTLLVGNTSVGYEALLNISGQYNVALGLNAGKLRFGGNKTLGDNNVYIGANTDSAAADTDNEIVIGASAVGNGSNSATYGDSNITKHFFTSGVVNITGGTLELASQAEIIGSSDNLKISADPDNVSGSSTIEFLVDGNEKMRIDNAGNVSFNLPSIGGTRELQFPQFNATNAKTIIRATGTSDYRQHLDILMNTAQADSAPTQVLRIDNSGNVGIGITNPADKLVVVGDIASTSSLKLTGNSSTPTAGAFIHRPASNELALGTASTERMRIDSSGNVGMGTSNPAYELHLYRNINGAVNLGVQNVNTGSSASAQLNMGASGNNFKIINYPDADTSNANRTDIGSTAGGSYLTFTTANSEKMRITSGGDVLIGKQSLSGSTAGFECEPSGIVRITRNSDSTLFLNRLTNDGVLLDFRKDGVQVGTISTNGNSLPSDRDFKKDISDLNLGLDFVSTLEPKKYRYKISDDNSPLLYGIIAQDLEQSLLDFGVNQNEAVLLQSKEKESEQDSGYALDYLKLTPILINAIKELKAEIELLKSQING